MASGVMHIRYGSEDIASKASRAARELGGVSSALDRIRDKVIDVPERSRNGNNLSKACSFLRKKQQDVERRLDALEVLKNRSDTFMSHVQTAEKRLSNNIKKDYKQFHKTTGIGKTGFAAFLEKIGQGAMNILKILNPVTALLTVAQAATSIAGAIKDWYVNGGGKYVVELFMAAAAAVFAVVAVLTAPITGPLAIVCAIAAGIIAIDALISAGKAAATVAYYYSGNQEMAHELSSMSVSEMMFGPDSTLGKVYDFVVGLACVVDVVNSLSKAVTDLKSVISKADGKGFTKFKNIISGYGKEVIGKNFNKFKDMVKQNGFGKAMGKILFSPISSVGAEIKGFKKITYDPIKVLMTLPKIAKTFDTSLYKNIRNWRTVLKFAM